jgi:hypothetical protein
MRDYWLSRFFFEMQQPQVRERFAADPQVVMDSYRLKPEVQAAVRANDIDALGRLTNPYLLRFYFGYIGMPEAEFLARIRGAKAAPHGATPESETAHG